MHPQPTPEEAATALNEVNDRRDQAASPAAHPAWTLWVIGAAAIGFGVASDLRPDLSTPLLYALVALALLLTFLPRWKRAGSAMGYQRSPDPQAAMSGRARLLRAGLMLTLMVLFAGGAVALRTFEAPYPTTIASVVAVATVLAGHQLLNRAARAPKA